MSTTEAERLRAQVLDCCPDPAHRCLACLERALQAVRALAKGASERLR